MKNLKIRKLISIFILVPLTSYGAGISNDDVVETNKNDFYELQPNESVNLVLNNKEVLINHQVIQNALGQKIKVSQEKSIGIKFHEESNTLDFSFLDGISHTINLDKVTSTPPNGIIY